MGCGCAYVSTTIDLPLPLPPSPTPGQKLKGLWEEIGSNNKSPQENVQDIKQDQNLTKMGQAYKYYNNQNKESQFATSNPQHYQQYIEIINKSNQLNGETTKNVLDYMFGQYRGMMTQTKSGIQKFKQLSKKEHPSLNCFLFLYTSTNFYYTINTQLKRKSYGTIKLLIAEIQKDLRSAKEFQGKIPETQTIYRCVSQQQKQGDVQPYKGQKKFWYTFLSCSTKKLKQFGSKVYHITLDEKIGHQYIVVPKRLTRYKSQNQVILFPYFATQCISVQDFPNLKETAYILKQISVEKIFEQWENLKKTVEN